LHDGIAVFDWISGDAAGAAREYERMKQVFRAPVVEPNERFPQDDET
jgi:hypothetical protein